MNHFTPASSFRSASDTVFLPILNEPLPFAKQLRALAAKFHFHYAAVHRLGSSGTPLKDATYVSILRHVDQSNWTLSDLLGEPALNKLLSGNTPVTWQHGPFVVRPKADPLSRLCIRFGVSVPFHNALGNHAALSLFDVEMSDVDLFALSQEAMPILDAILAVERENTTVITPLSAREVTCLQWAAAGKTSIETGMIMGLSSHTVNQYLTSAAVKLQAVNRTHAVTKAVGLGLINVSVI